MLRERPHEPWVRERARVKGARPAGYGPTEAISTPEEKSIFLFSKKAKTWHKQFLPLSTRIVGVPCSTIPPLQKERRRGRKAAFLSFFSSLTSFLQERTWERVWWHVRRDRRVCSQGEAVQRPRREKREITDFLPVQNRRSNSLPPRPGRAAGRRSLLQGCVSKTHHQNHHPSPQPRYTFSSGHHNTKPLPASGKQSHGRQRRLAGPGGPTRVGPLLSPGREAFITHTPLMPSPQGSAPSGGTSPLLVEYAFAWSPQRLRSSTRPSQLCPDTTNSAM